MRQLLLFTFLAIAVPSTVLAQLPEKCVLSACPECDCYWSTECGSGKHCDYSSGCTHVGKKDGTCKSGAGALPSGGLSVAATALGLWLDAYQVTTADKGLPSADIVKRIQAINLPSQDRRRIRFAAFNTIDVLLGFDFGHPRGDCDAYDARCLGILRIRPDREAVQLLRAVRPAFVLALQTRDPKPLQKSLNGYWKQYPNFRPHHSGRCYPHGHPEYPFKAVSACQLDELTRILADLTEKSVPSTRQQ